MDTLQARDRVEMEVKIQEAKARASRRTSRACQFVSRGHRDLDHVPNNHLEQSVWRQSNVLINAESAYPHLTRTQLVPNPEVSAKQCC